MDINMIEKDRAVVSRAILTALPEWFGIEEAREDYVRHAASAPMLTASFEGEVVGYLSLAEHFGRNCEVHSMAVLPSHHRKGIGRELVETAASWARHRGHRYLSVKTLADTHPDPNYAATRRFYARVGFRPFEVLDAQWGPNLPCLLMIKELSEYRPCLENIPFRARGSGPTRCCAAMWTWRPFPFRT